jgi:hypothetical protein
MARQFDPRKVLRDVSNGLLRELFAQRDVLQDVPWDEMDETHIEPVFEGWQEMPERDRLEVQVILQDVNELADERGLNVLVDEVHRWAPERVSELAALEGRHDKAMWVYLNLPEAFDEAAMFARADALAAGRYWVKRNSLPKKALTADEKLRTSLADALTEYYWPTQMRGQHCSVEHYQRANGTEYFFAYLDDYPDSHIIFDDAGQMQKRSDRYAFTNVFAYTPTDGALELYAQGGKKVIDPLQVLFCKSVLGADIEPADPAEAVYQLDHLTNRSVPLPTEPGDRIAEVQVRSLRLEIVGAPRRRMTLDADPEGHRGDIYQMIERYLNAGQLPISKMKVIHARFCLIFMHEGSGRPKTLMFNVGRNSCDLKSKTDDMRAIGERCLKLWRIVDA